MKTLTPTGLSKLCALFAGTISHGAYIADGLEQSIPIVQIEITPDTVRVLVYLDDNVTGHITQISLIDYDGDVIATAQKDFIKPDYKGLYAAFKYKFNEDEGRMSIRT